MVMSARPEGSYNTRMILDCPDDTGMLSDIMSHVFPEGEQLQKVLEVFEKKCRLYRAHSDEEVSENFQGRSRARELARMPSSGSAATLDSFSSIKDEFHQLQPRGSSGAKNSACGRRSGAPG